ncbi:MAG: dihydropteroate synthase [Desulfomonilaceae bacterium]|nr:dihydropteroate synthase [Desulfomonilaceae bacterium]
MIVIGEKINATRGPVKAIIEQRDSQGLKELAEKQVRAGAGYIDVNVGTGVGSREHEMADMDWAVGVLTDAIEPPLCVDSADPAVLEAGLRAMGNRKAMINSAKADEDCLPKIVGLAARYDAGLVGLAMDESGIPPTVEGRLAACAKIAEECRRQGVPLEKVFFDPLVLPVSTDITQGMVTLRTIREIKVAFEGARTVMGLSNISFGLPDRLRLNAAFLHMALSAGLDAAIADATDDELMAAVRTGEVLVGRDRHCRRYSRAFRR